MMLTRRSHHLQSFWIILEDASTPRRYCLQYIDSSRIRVEAIQHSYPSSICHKLPAYMNNALEAIISNSISCSFCSESLLQCIGNMARYDYHDEMLQMFNSKEAFELHCIEMITCYYIYKSKQVLRCDSRAIYSMEKYVELFLESKLRSREINAKRRLDEQYLGKVPFSIELVRSFNVFIKTALKMVGFLPYEIKYVSVVDL